ncbi:MAG: alkaline phosphatase D family protein [Pirellulales bacterium]
MLFAVLVVEAVSAKPPIMTPPETPVLGEVDPFLIDAIYNSDDVEASLASVQDNAKFNALIAKHDLRLFGGPMLGSVTPTSAKVWVRTPKPARVQAVVEGSGRSPVVETQAESDYTAVLEIDGLKPWTEYTYDILVDGESALGDLKPKFRTNPTRDQKVEFAVAFGGGARYVPEKERMWDTIAKERPHAFLFLGDNLYIDEPRHRGKQRAMYYRRQLRPEYQRLVSQSGTYAIWDDHDFGADDSAGGLHPFEPAWKLPVWRVFQENWVNPSYGGGPEQPGCWFDFSIGDVDFFMTDGRYYRDFKQGTMLGPTQKAWLLEKLKASKATFKVIASGTLWTEHADKGGADSWWGVKQEREEILSLIDREKIPGVILISADRHRTDIYRLERPAGYDLYEFETSKLTNNHTHNTKKEALFSYNKGNFYGLMRFDLSRDDPRMTFECITIDGEVVHRFPLQRSQLESAK